MTGALRQRPRDLGHTLVSTAPSNRMGRSGWRRCAKILSISARYSAAVRVRTVSMRATKHTRPSRMPPRATVVLPISMAKIIILFSLYNAAVSGRTAGSFSGERPGGGTLLPAAAGRDWSPGLFAEKAPRWPAPHRSLSILCQAVFYRILPPVTSPYKDFVVLAELLHYTKVRNVETVRFCRRFNQWI